MREVFVLHGLVVVGSGTLEGQCGCVSIHRAEEAACDSLELHLVRRAGFKSSKRLVFKKLKGTMNTFVSAFVCNTREKVEQTRKKRRYDLFVLFCIACGLIRNFNKLL